MTDAPLIVRAALGEQTPYPPVWFMRQAGRSLPEYRQIRANNSMLEACLDAELLTEITMQPVRRHNVDAAILFSDIVLPLKAIGVDLDIKAGVGPVIANPVRSKADLDQFRAVTAQDVAPVIAGIKKIREQLGDKALIGFAGAPFTLASYLVEGGPSRTFTKTKAMMHGDPQLWDSLLAAVGEVSASFLQLQVGAGVHAVQLFDSWVGAVARRDYVQFIQPHSAKVLAAVSSVPRIHFGVGTGELLSEMGRAGADVVGIDYRVELADGISRLGNGYSVQGNLDPALLFAPWPAIEAKVREIVQTGRSARGHIFNLGHGVLPETDPDVLTRVVELVHSLEH